MSKIGVVTVLAVLIATDVGIAQTWVQALPSFSPSPRRAGALAFDGVLGTTLLYGGLLSPTAINNETWIFDGSNWILQAPTTMPPPRWGHRMVYDRARQRVVTYGGRSPTIATAAADTWEWDGATWTQVFPAASPSARAFYSMAYDERRERTVIFGSQFTTNGGETWEYDGTTWLLNPAPGPASRETPALVYDRGRGVMVLFGGWNAQTATMYNDTWEFDGVTWTQVPTATLPIARYRAGVTYDELRGRVVLYGGFGNATALQDTWEYDGNDWTQIASSGPASSTEAYVAFDPFLGQTLHFGGSSAGGTTNQTWSYAGPTTATFALFGAASPTSAGLPLLAANPPQLGQNFTLSVSNLPPTAGDTVLAIGFSNESWSGLDLPLDLGPGGFSGCSLEVSVDSFFVLSSLGGSSSFVYSVPNNPVLTNLQFYCQALSPDPLAPNGAGGVTRAGHAVMGN